MDCVLVFRPRVFEHTAADKFSSKRYIKSLTTSLVVQLAIEHTQQYPTCSLNSTAASPPPLDEECA